MRYGVSDVWYGHSWITLFGLISFWARVGSVPNRFRIGPLLGTCRIFHPGPFRHTD